MPDSRTIPLVRPGRGRGGLGRFFVVGGTLVAVAVIIALIVSWAGDQSPGLPVSETLPPAAPAKTTAPAAPKPPAAVPARPATPSVRVRNCDPIFGNGVPHPVASSARDGDPAGCGEAHSVLLAALNGSSGTVGRWHCVSRPADRTIAVCTSAGGRRILARD